MLGEENGGIDLINDSLEETIRKQNELKRNSAKDYMAQNASAIKKAQDNLSKNYYNKSNRKIATEERYWNEWDWDDSTADWMAKQKAMIQAAFGFIDKETGLFIREYGRNSTVQKDVEKDVYNMFNEASNLQYLSIFLSEFLLFSLS